ncbi:hypothetical protein E4T56_gene20435 [Termitomyces sp. T112]|nr:hypothetical protein E4T56_gene20435 [Termitomyces sp. T112]
MSWDSEWAKIQSELSEAFTDSSLIPIWRGTAQAKVVSLLLAVARPYIASTTKKPDYVQIVSLSVSTRLCCLEARTIAFLTLRTHDIYGAAASFLCYVSTTRSSVYGNAKMSVVI